MVRTRRRAIAASLVLAAVLSCQAQTPWTFGLTRSFYSAESTSRGAVLDSSRDLSAFLLLLPVPIILDIVFLPVAVPRDLIVRGHLDD